MHHLLALLAYDLASNVYFALVKLKRDLKYVSSKIQRCCSSTG